MEQLPNQSRIITPSYRIPIPAGMEIAIYILEFSPDSDTGIKKAFSGTI
jgi:hypothetical protein